MHVPASSLRQRRPVVAASAGQPPTRLHGRWVDLAVGASGAGWPMQQPVAVAAAAAAAAVAIALAAAVVVATAAVAAVVDVAALPLLGSRRHSGAGVGKAARAAAGSWEGKWRKMPTKAAASKRRRRECAGADGGGRVLGAPARLRTR